MGDYRIGMSKTETGRGLFDDTPYQKKLNKIDVEIFMLEKYNPSVLVEKLIEGMLDRARDFPLYRLLEAKPKQNILCPFHPDTAPSLHLYELHGYCFVCNTRVDSIKWLRTQENLSFFMAVKKLNELAGLSN